jgi:hypothetical protein
MGPAYVCGSDHRSVSQSYARSLRRSIFVGFSLCDPPPLKPKVSFPVPGIPSQAVDCFSSPPKALEVLIDEVGQGTWGDCDVRDDGSCHYGNRLVHPSVTGESDAAC